MDKVVWLLNKASDQSLENMSWKICLLYFLFHILLEVILFVLPIMLVGCSFGAVQKAGRDALAEAICLYEKKVEYNSDDFNKCLDSHTR